MREIKYILSNAGWSSEFLPDDRRNALEKALQKEKLYSVILALRWVEKKWERLNPNAEIAEACREDIKWLEENFVQDSDLVIKKDKDTKETIYVVSKFSRPKKIICRSCGSSSKDNSPMCPKCGKIKYCAVCSNLPVHCKCK